MEKVIFFCPECAFKKEISQSDIPPRAKQCVCPSCRNTFAIAEVISSLNGDAATHNKEKIEYDSQQKAEDNDKIIQDKYQELIESSFSKLEEKDDLAALALLEKAESIKSTPIARSYLAYCRAKIKYEFSDAIKMCLKCLKEESDNADHYLNLARIYLLANKRKPALQTLRKGLKLGPHTELMNEFNKFDKRKPPIFSSLPREHFLNKNIGKLFYRLGLR